MENDESDKEFGVREEFSEKRTKRFFKVLSYNWMIMPSTVMILFVSELSIRSWLNVCS
jgi:hypothetical protein